MTRKEMYDVKEKLAAILTQKGVADELAQDYRNYSIKFIINSQADNFSVKQQPKTLCFNLYSLIIDRLEDFRVLETYENDILKQSH